MNTYPKRALIEGVMSKDLVYMSEGFCLFISNMVQRKATSYLLAADGSAA